MKPPNLNDSELTQQLREGSESAFRQIYDRYSTKLFYFARNLNVQIEDAQEIVQETFVKLWEYRHQADSTLSLNAYLFTIARNLIYNQVKKHAVRQRYFAGMLREGEPQGEMRDTELWALLERLMQELPEKCREVFRLSRFDGFMNQQIAEQLGISKSTVENHINKALHHFRKRLAELGYALSMLLTVWY